MGPGDKPQNDNGEAAAFASMTEIDSTDMVVDNTYAATNEPAPMPSPTGLLIDLGGVVYQAGAAIPGSIEAIARLRDKGIALRFLTNTTSKPVGKLLEQLQSYGLLLDRTEIFTPAMAARAYIEQHDLKPHYLMRDTLLEDFRGLPEGTHPAVVVADAGEKFTFHNLNDAFRRLEAGADLIALATNRKFVDDDGKISLDTGAFVAALEYASECVAVVLGKPSKDFFHMAVADLELKPENVAMIGDDAEFDVSAAVRAGLSGYLVCTGKWQPGATDGLDPQPTAVFDDLAAIANRIG